MLFGQFNKPWRADVWTQKGKERKGRVERRAWKHTHHHLQDSQPVGCAGQTASGVRCVTQGAQTQRAGTTWRGERGREGGFKREGTYVYLWLFMLLYSRNQHYIVK